MRYWFSLLVTIAFLSPFSTAKDSSSIAEMFFARQTSFDQPLGFEIYQAKGGVEGTSYQPIGVTLPKGTLIPKGTLNLSGYNSVPTTFIDKDGRKDRGKTYIKNQDTNVYSVGTYGLNRVDLKFKAGGERRRVSMRRPDGTVDRIATWKDGARVQLLNAELEITENADGTKTARTHYLVEISGYYTNPSRRVGIIDAAEFETQIEQEKCETGGRFNNSVLNLLSGFDDIDNYFNFLNDPIDDSELNQILGHIGQCITNPNIKENTFQGRAIRHILKEGHWDKRKDAQLSIDGQTISPEQSYQIDALARTLYHELDDPKCNEDDDGYLRGMAKMIMNRADYETRFHNRKGKNAGFIFDAELDGYDPTGDDANNALPYVLEARGCLTGYKADGSCDGAINKQFDPWIKSKISRYKNRQLKKDSLLCPEPVGPVSQDNWRKAVRVASEVILRRQEFESTVNGVTQYFYTHKNQNSPAVPTRLCNVDYNGEDKLSPQDRSKYCNPKLRDGASANGKEFAPEASSRSHSQYYCLQRWDAYYIKPLNELMQEL